MAKQSLFQACKRVFQDGISGTYEVGNNNIFLELYGQNDIDQNNEIGNSSEENIVVVAGDTITIPEGYTLTPVKPKKSLVVICNTFVNNGTVSMKKKAPNVLPHDLFIIDRTNGSPINVIIPAYANNGKLNNFLNTEPFPISYFNGNNGTDHQCGSGGLGQSWPISGYNSGDKDSGYGTISGSGYAFGGGAGSGGIITNNIGIYYDNSVDSTYPMRGSNGYKPGGEFFSSGGVGNPTGTNTTSGYNGVAVDNGTGCGGRIIIFCCNFTNNGIINVNGTSANVVKAKNAHGGASGAGAIDVFYTTNLESGTMTATGGSGKDTTGAGGDGCVSLNRWGKTKVLKPIERYMSKANMVYFLTNYIQRLKQGED